jgi:opacity protein-like surface antigen
MKAIILAAAAAAALAGAAEAQTVIQERETGVHSAPTAGATPQARDYPTPDTTVLEQRRSTTVVEPERRVIEERGAGGTAVEVERRSN